MQLSATDARQKCSNVNEPLYVPSQSVLLSTYADVKSIIWQQKNNVNFFFQNILLRLIGIW